MNIYVSNLILILIWGAAMHWNGITQKKKKIFCAVVGLQWILISGLRHISVGPDTNQYKVGYFDLTVQMSWHEVFQNIINTYFGDANLKAPGYRLLEKLIQTFTSSYQVYLIAIAIIFTVPMVIFIYRHSVEPCISFIFYSCVSYSMYSITGLRQAVAASLMIFIGYRWVRERKLLPYLLLCIIASTIHASAFVFLVFYILAGIKITKPYIVCVLLASIGILFLFQPVLFQVATISGYGVYLRNVIKGTPWVFAALCTFFTAVTIWRHKIILKNKPEASIWIQALFITLLATFASFTMDIFMRITHYFLLYLLVLIPEILHSFPRKERNLAYSTVLFLMLFLFLRDVPLYSFFWQ